MSPDCRFAPTGQNIREFRRNAAMEVLLDSGRPLAAACFGTGNPFCLISNYQIIKLPIWNIDESSHTVLLMEFDIHIVYRPRPKVTVIFTRKFPQQHANYVVQVWWFK
jgi:hypothetical protein